MFEFNIDWQKYHDAVESCVPLSLEGRVVQVVGLIVEGTGIGTGIGSICRIFTETGDEILAEVVGFRDERILLMPYGDTTGIRAGSRIILVDKTPAAAVGDQYVGRVIDGMGHPLDGKGPVVPSAHYPFTASPSIL